MKKLLTISIVLFSCLFAFCGGKNEVDPNKVVVAVTILPEKAFVEAVGGSMVDIIVMVPPSASAETYEPSAKAMQALYDADVYFSIEVPAEAFILDSIPSGLKQVDLAGICREQYQDLALGLSRDPHIWLSPKRAALMVDAIAKELSLLKPEAKKTFESNARSFKNELNQVAEEIENTLSSLTVREFACFHPAFNYFADDFGISMFALEEEGKESTAKRLGTMIDLAKQRGIKTIFYQAEVDSKQAVTFAQEVGGKAVMLEPLSPDYLGNLKRMAEAFLL